MALGYTRRVAGLSLAALLGTVGSAHAISISASISGPNTPYLTASTGRHGEFRSATTVLDAGGSGADSIGTFLDARTRYQSITSADTGSFNLGQVVASTSAYTITFNVTAPAYITYNLVIDTSRLGAFTLVDDTALNGATRADLGAVSGTLNAVANAGLGLADLAAANGAGNTNIATINTPFSQTSNLVLSGLSGNQSLTLAFNWTSLVFSSPGANQTTTNTDNGSFLFGGDEAAVRMGLTNSASSITGGMTADDYPGVGPRTAANDGHFVNFGLTVLTPEPGTALLLGLGISGLAVAGRKRG